MPSRLSRHLTGCPVTLQSVPPLTTRPHSARSQVNLSVPDIEKILDTLIYDGKVERRLQAGSGVQEQLKLYRATQTLLPPVGLVKTPCGICPVGDAAGVTGRAQSGLAVVCDRK